MPSKPLRQSNKLEKGVPRPVDLAALSERLNTHSYSQTPEQQKEQEGIVSSQIGDAAESLRSFDSAERVGGAEQLAAYPTPEAEQLLVEALQTDKEAEVRSAAAASLSYVTSPKSATFSVLLTALEDESEDVQDSVLQTLIAHMQHLDAESTKEKKLVSELKRKATSKAVSRATREGIRSYLSNL